MLWGANLAPGTQQGLPGLQGWCRTQGMQENLVLSILPVALLSLGLGHARSSPWYPCQDHNAVGCSVWASSFSFFLSEEPVQPYSKAPRCAVVVGSLHCHISFGTGRFLRFFRRLSARARQSEHIGGVAVPGTSPGKQVKVVIFILQFLPNVERREKCCFLCPRPWHLGIDIFQQDFVPRWYFSTLPSSVCTFPACLEQCSFFSLCP